MRKTLIEGVRNYLIVPHTSVRNSVIVNNFSERGSLAAGGVMVIARSDQAPALSQEGGHSASRSSRGTVPVDARRGYRMHLVYPNG